MKKRERNNIWRSRWNIYISSQNESKKKRLDKEVKTDKPEYIFSIIYNYKEELEKVKKGKKIEKEVENERKLWNFQPKNSYNKYEGFWF